MARGAWECSPTRSKRQHSGYGDSLEEQRAGGAEALSHDGRPRGSEKPKPTTARICAATTSGRSDPNPQGPETVPSERFVGRTGGLALPRETGTDVTS